MKLSITLTALILATIASDAFAGRHKNKDKKMKNDDKKKNKGSKGGKPPSGGVGAGGGMGSKASKGGDTGGMGMFDECVMANPTLEMTDAFASDPDINTDYDTLLEHSILVNEDYSMGVSQWVAENVTAEVVSMVGYGVGVAHLPAFGNLEEDIQVSSICKLVHVLVEQMEETCHYDVYESAYANIAANVMAGFSWGVEANVMVGDCENANGKTFMKMYGKLLTDDTLDVIMM
mmetsp:Transcript_33100/g.67443  ORF Transcript_33100/g.67443 Transcript_33100/m.67443 type:complete len:233 (+) Transcript_33100:211-909(+)